MLKWSKFLVFALAACAPASAGTVGWYNGDFNGNNGLANGINNGSWSQANTYDDFVVPAGGWLVTGVFSNDLMSFTGTTQAYWEIRSGVSAGNGGTLVASGTDTATQTATGRSGFGYTEYTVEVDGLSLFLAPGTYWLTVAPVGPGSGNSYVSTTSGANAIGNPPGNDDNSFFNSSTFGANFTPASNYVGAPADFSEGVLTGAPEPGTLGMMFGAGLLGLGFLRRKC
jgi:hypothetical protein